MVCDDADIKKAAQEVFWGCMYNMGQNCVAGTRILVHEKVMKEFEEELKIYCLNNVRIGDPNLKETNFGPLNNQM